MKKSTAGARAKKTVKAASQTSKKASATRAKVPSTSEESASARASAKRPTAKVAPRRADYGAPVEQFFQKKTGELRAILDALRAMVEEAAPQSSATLKWGMPFYTLNGETLCAIAAFKSHVNLILPGGPGTFSDPNGLLEGEGKTGQHLKLRSQKDVPEKLVRTWLKVAAKNARAKASAE